MAVLWSLFSAFFRVGLFTFGGGYAMLPMLQREVVDRHGWATETELLDCFAIAQCTPGVIAVNTATYVGYRQKKIIGGLVATLGVVTPSLIIITLIAAALTSVRDLPIVIHAFAGIRIGVAALMVKTLVNLYRKGVKGAFANGICIAALLTILLFRLSPVWIVIAAVLIGIILRKAGKAL